MANLQATHSVGNSLITYLRNSYPEPLRTDHPFPQVLKHRGTDLFCPLIHYGPKDANVLACHDADQAAFQCAGCGFDKRPDTERALAHER